MNNSLNITGQVVDAQTNTGVTGFNVEVWDKSLRFQSAMAVLTTDEHGRFNVLLDLRQFGFETPPTLIFKVLKDGVLFTSTDNAVVWNTQTEDDVTIFIRTVSRPDRPVGKDRINATQVLKTANFVQQSDFKGVYQQTKDKFSMPVGFFTDMLTNTFKNADINPIRVKSTPEAGIYKQDVAVATTNLQAQQVQVNEVLPYNPQLNSDSFKILTSAPIKVAAGQKVNLYQENGKVMYYSVVTDQTQATTGQPQAPTAGIPVSQPPAAGIPVSQPPAAGVPVSQPPIAGIPVSQPPVAGLPVTEVPISHITTEQFTKLQDELTVSKQEAVAKDEQINQLKIQMEALQKDHLEMKSVLTSDSFTKLIAAQKTTGLRPPGETP
jgi:hypothetical protein